MNRPSFRVRTALLALFMIGGVSTYLPACEILINITVPVILPTCPNYIVETDFIVNGDLCISGTTTMVEGGVNIQEASCAPALLTPSLIITQSALTITTIQDTVHYNLLNDFEKMRANSEIVSTPTLQTEVASGALQSAAFPLATALSADGSIALFANYNRV